MEEIRKKIGARLRTLRQERRLTQEEKAVDETDEPLSSPVETAIEELVPLLQGCTKRQIEFVRDFIGLLKRYI